MDTLPREATPFHGTVYAWNGFITERLYFLPYSAQFIYAQEKNYTCISSNSNTLSNCVVCMFEMCISIIN